MLLFKIYLSITHRNNNRLVLKIKDEYKQELQTPETMKLFDSTKKLIGKTKTLLSVEPSNLVFLQTYNIEFHEIT